MNPVYFLVTQDGAIPATDFRSLFRHDYLFLWLTLPTQYLLMNITAPIEGFLPPTGELLCSFLVNTAILQDKKRRGLYFNSCPLGNIPNFSFFTSQQQGRGGEARQRPGGHGHGPVPQAPGPFDLDAVHLSHGVGAVSPQGVGAGGGALAPSDAVAGYPYGVAVLLYI